MSVRLPARCVDINTPYCPCILAEANHCVFCSHLQGGSTCSCDWVGLCVLYEKQWQDKPAPWRQEATLPVRTDMEAQVVKRERITDTVLALELVVTPQLAAQLDKTGAFVFIRRPDDPPYFQFPIGVVKVEGERIQIMVETTGPKSNRVVTGDNLVVRGPYYNGILGQPWIDKITRGHIIVIAGGMGQAPALPIMRTLRYNNNQVTAILAPGKVGQIFITQEAVDLGVQVRCVTSLRREGLPNIQEIISQEPVNLMVSCGPDAQHYGVLDMLQQCQADIPMAATNNATMCCGEGICGSCQKETVHHTVIRTCKVQTDFSLLL